MYSIKLYTGHVPISCESEDAGTLVGVVPYGHEVDWQTLILDGGTIPFEPGRVVATGRAGHFRIVDAGDKVMCQGTAGDHSFTIDGRPAAPDMLLNHANLVEGQLLTIKAFDIVPAPA